MFSGGLPGMGSERPLPWEALGRLFVQWHGQRTRRVQIRTPRAAGFRGGPRAASARLQNGSSFCAHLLSDLRRPDGVPLPGTTEALGSMLDALTSALRGLGQDRNQAECS